MKLIWEQADIDVPELIVRGRLEDKKTAELIQTLQGLVETERNVKRESFFIKKAGSFFAKLLKFNILRAEEERFLEK